MNWVQHVEDAFQNAENGKSKLTREILTLKGMSGAYTRHFYNNLCSGQNIRYLEIGTWAGSTFVSAMYRNEATCVGVDNWSKFGGPRDEFMKVFNTYKGKNNAAFHESNSWSPELIRSLESMKFNVYVYDGDHSEQSQYDALAKYLPCMDDTFVFVVDDWNRPDVRKGTERAIRDTGVGVVRQYKIRMTWDDTDTPTDLGARTWWNGIAVFILEK